MGVPMGAQRDTTTQGWILFVASAFLWLAVGQSGLFIVLGLSLATSHVFLAAGLALGVLAWLVAWFVSRNGAPSFTWWTTALGSVQLAGLLALMLRQDLPSAALKRIAPGAYQRSVRSFLAFVVAVVFVAVAPVIVAWVTSVTVRRGARANEAVEESAVGI